MGSPRDATGAPGAVGIVSGSGLALSNLLDRVDRVASFSEYEGLAANELAGHPRSFTFGCSGLASVVLQSGRFHFYEGLDYRAITRPVDLMYEWGVRAILFTNVAGGLTPDFEVGDIVAIDRLLTWPYGGWSERPDSIAPDRVLDRADAVGTYVWVHGPSYETPAEIRLLQKWGGSVVGMSTAPEVQRCRQLGIRTAVLSCVTNNCCSQDAPTHENVIAVAARMSSKLTAMIRDTLDRDAFR
jgi:purine-nucleoside phosphorylase